MTHAVAQPAVARLSVDDLLGGPSVLAFTPRCALDWVAAIRRGLPFSAVDALTGLTHLSRTELAAAVGIPERTLARRKREGRLNSEESAKLIRLAQAVERGEDVFEDLDTAVDWLKSANPSLGGATPLSLLDTEIGAQSVIDTLGRIEQGVFA
jgi:putative toxin-antitoxin system antitoxin component (TIGR02293 family)